MPMPTQISLKSLIAPCFYGVHNALKQDTYSEIELQGGRSSGKSSFLALEIVYGMLKDRKANAIIYRKVRDTLRDSVYPQMIWALDKMGLNGRYVPRISPLEIILKTGQRIMFRGADDAGKSKSIKLDYGYFKYLWFEELTEFNGESDLLTIEASVLRGEGGKAFILKSYNPPKSARNWVNAAALLPKPGRLLHKSTYLDLPHKWLGENIIRLAESVKESNPNAYRHEFLGEITGTGGQVFDNLEIREIGEDEIKTFDRIFYGGDFGFAVDPDAVMRVYFNRKRQELYLFGEIYGARMSTDILAQRVKQLTGRDYVVFDNEDPRMIAELKLRGVRALSAKKGRGSVEHGIRWLQSLRKIVIDPKRCPNAAREFSAYEYLRDKNGDFLSAYPDKDNHSIDAVRYAVEVESLRKRIETMNRKDLGL